MLPVIYLNLIAVRVFEINLVHTVGPVIDRKIAFSAKPGNIFMFSSDHEKSDQTNETPPFKYGRTAYQKLFSSLLFQIFKHDKNT